MTNPETGYEKAHRQVEQIFRRFFPARGMVTREGQIQLCHTMLDALFGRDVALCDAGVGLGKNLCLPGCLCAVAAAKATADATTRGDLYRQHRAAERHYQRIHSVFIRRFNTKRIHSKTYLCCAAKRERTLRL